MSIPASPRLPDAALRRFSLYLRSLGERAAAGESTVSSAELAAAAGTTPATLRKDLSLLGSHGRRGVGYDVSTLVPVLESALGLSTPWRLVIVGAGHLGRALAGYPGFATRGFGVVGLVDAAPAVVGTKVAGLKVTAVEGLGELVRDKAVTMAVLTVPARAAQDAADVVVAAGVRSILSFAPVALRVPHGVDVRRVDLATELQLLAHHAAAAATP